MLWFVVMHLFSTLLDLIRIARLSEHDIFQAETVLGRHRQLVKRKWTYNPKGRGGRPRIDQELERLVVRLAQDNHDWDYDRIEGELAKLGFTITDESIANILQRHNIPPAPDRGRSPSWRHLIDPLQRPDPSL